MSKLGFNPLRTPRCDRLIGTMDLGAGTRLGPYEIVDQLGKGGMGEVYRATDTRLHRDVAIKVSSETFSDLFEREARAVAALNHPHIGHLYDVGPNYLVMELVEGETLAERIQKGPILLEEALELARQIVEALEAAHEKGITHRDLKPANIKITPEGSVKVLDFGLAKIAEPIAEASSDSENSPTLTQLAASRVGAVMGTAGYMAPEQAKGKKIDKRADIWAFGVVLYEMVTGKRLFKGEDLTETLAAVVMKDPDLADAPAKVRRLVEHCLEKNPKKRLRDIGDAWKLLEEPAASTMTAASRPRFGRLPWAVAAAALIAVLVLGIGLWRASQPEDRPLVRLGLDLPGYQRSIAISDDGSRIAYVTQDTDGISRVATRLLSEPDVHVLAGTDRAYNLTFSPDGEWIVFAGQSRLKKVSVQGGAPFDLASAPYFHGASWGRGGFLIAALNSFAGLVRISDTGGEPEQVSRPGETAYSPQILPGGDVVLFTEGPADSPPQIALLTLATSEVTTLVPNASSGRFLPTSGASRGNLVYLSGGTLFAEAFDAAAGTLSGQPVPILDGVSSFAASASGSLIYQVGSGGPDNWPVAWLRNDGSTEPLLLRRGNYSYPRLSPDGRLLALTVDDDLSATRRIIVYDWSNDRVLPLTQPGEVASKELAWSPDSKYLAFRTEKEGRSRLVWKRADGSQPEHTLLEGEEYWAVTSISPDGKHIVFVRTMTEASSDLWVAPLDLTDPDEPVVGNPESLVQTPQAPGLEYGATFSPDGKWIAYGSDHSGQWKCYVQPFPGPGEPLEIAGGGCWPQWSTNGRQLFLKGSAGGISVIDYQVNGDAFVASQPRPWSKTPIRAYGGSAAYTISPDGERAVIFPMDEASADQSGAPRMGFLLNFFDELRRRAPLE